MKRRLLILMAASAALCVRGYGAVEEQSHCTAEHNLWNGGSRYAEAREERLASGSENFLNPGMNGSVRVHGWDKPDMLVEACVRTEAENEADAKALAGQVKITDGAGRAVASGPEHHTHQNWSVSYQVWLPENTPVQIEASNGSIAVEGLHSALRFKTLNGSVRLSEVAGDVRGETTNGSLHVSLANHGTFHDGVDVSTTNGSVRLQLPSSFDAKVEAATVNGGIRTDFPITVSGDVGKRLSFAVGNGSGPILRANTVNGSVQISRGA